jgi:hypothetical protein
LADPGPFVLVVGLGERTRQPCADQPLIGSNHAVGDRTKKAL